MPAKDSKINPNTFTTRPEIEGTFGAILDKGQTPGVTYPVEWVEIGDPDPTFAPGTTNNQDTPIGRVPVEDFTTIMVTNALSPLRVMETLADVVAPAGLVGAMTSGQGSITNNTTGGREVYRGSKAALNMFVRSYAAR